MRASATGLYIAEACFVTNEIELIINKIEKENHLQIDVAGGFRKGNNGT
jgi:hypothetical protein